MMNTTRRLLALVACSLILASTFTPAAQAQDKPCLTCHAALTQKKVVHAALDKGCASCHAEIDANGLPHQSKSKTAKGPSTAASARCLNCHDKKLFEGKFVHAPVAASTCLGCHDPHSSDYIGLLKKPPAALCLDCHPDIAKGPHVIAGFSRSGHPLGNDKKTVQDPLRPGRPFYCASCHEPHRSELAKLNRFPKGMVSCQKCHKM